jgi:hypothetical protein
LTSACSVIAVVEDNHFRALLTYLNNAVEVGNFPLGRTPVHSMMMSEFHLYQTTVRKLLSTAPGKHF